MQEQMSEQDEKKWARRAHLSSILSYVVTFILLTKSVPYAFIIGMASGILLPLYILFTKGRKSEFVAEHAKEAGFMASFMALFGTGVEALWGSSTLKWFPLAGASFYHSLTVITASIKASYKKFFSYPLSIFRRSREKKANSTKEEKLYSNLDKFSSGIDKETLQKALEKRKEIAQLSQKIQDPNIQDKVGLILQSLDSMFENFEKDPKDIKTSRQFLSYYLDATIKIIRKYIDLSEQKVISPELTESLRKVDSILSSIKEAFDKHHNKLLSNDIMELDTEIEVMEKTMKLEGFG
ncbi:MAG: 5-bromo-4-chloroindolyl phosphate hydrolysis family protein [Spirochaetota bacterium]